MYTIAGDSTLAQNMAGEIERTTHFASEGEKESKFKKDDPVWHLKFVAPFRPKERLAGTILKVHWPLLGGNTYDIEYDYHERGKLKTKKAFEVQEDNIAARNS